MIANDFWRGKHRGHVLGILFAVIVAGGHLVLITGCGGGRSFLGGECGSDADCDDGKFCTVDACYMTYIPWPIGSCGGSSPCAGSTPICDESQDRCLPCQNDEQCNDLVGCTDDSCNTETGECIHIDNCVDNGIFCDGTAFCEPTLGCITSGRACFGPTPVCDETLKGCLPCERDDQCEDGNGCTVDSCIATTGECLNQYCPDDGNPCTFESCDGVTCEHQPITCERTEDCPGGCTCNGGLCSVQ